ncbi:GlcG/HbpS family heme-binding protein [Stutzerimonas stutzeri]|uniref:NahX n=1 Tax=Stutzerimonas stutzeri KOS6 TaxID=1218352 RepID=A0A061JVI0_STUST|nr:heme-binding protein [Stutzerimonas stutzeri]EWC42595.1 NahX [Stutzerimonas stutzeri KOS6]
MTSTDFLRPQGMRLDWRGAAAAAQAALDCAERQGIRVHVALVDRSGNTLAYLRMCEAFLHSESIAIDKAYTAASFGFATGKWLEVIGDNLRLHTGLITRPRLVVLGGGLPIIVDGCCIGGVGVSGGSEEQDEACARVALAALGLDTAE